MRKKSPNTTLKNTATEGRNIDVLGKLVGSSEDKSEVLPKIEDKGSLGKSNS